MEPEKKHKNDPMLAQSLKLEDRCRAFLSRVNNISFNELLQLAKDAGFSIKKPDGTSHWVSRHPTHEGGPLPMTR